MADDTSLNKLMTPYDVPTPPHTQTPRRARWSIRHWHQSWRELTFFQGVKALGGSILQNPATAEWAVEADVSPDKRKGLERRVRLGEAHETTELSLLPARRLTLTVLESTSHIARD